MARRMMTALNFACTMRSLHKKIYRQEERGETRARRTQVRRACLLWAAKYPEKALQIPTVFVGNFVGDNRVVLKTIHVAYIWHHKSKADEGKWR